MSITKEASAIKCPVCDHAYEGEADCTQCGSDLRLMLGIWNQASLFYNDALTLAKAKCWTQALEEVNRAILYVGARPEFHLFRGKILAHLHRYTDASEAWEFCLELNSADLKAQNCLKQISTLLDVISSVKVKQEQEVAAPEQEVVSQTVEAPEQQEVLENVTLAEDISEASEELAEPAPSISSKISKQISKLQPRFDSIFNTFSQALMSVAPEKSSPRLAPA